MKSVMEQEQTQKKYISTRRFWSVWGTLAGILVLVVLFYAWKIWALNQENARFEVSIQNTQARLQTIAPGSEQLIKKRSEILQRAIKNRTNWSTVLEQITDLETAAARFTDVSLTDQSVSATCQTTSWKSFAAFIETLENDARIQNLRILSTNVLSPAVAGATQSAKLSFDFSPTEQ